MKKEIAFSAEKQLGIMRCCAAVIGLTNLIDNLARYESRFRIGTAIPI